MLMVQLTSFMQHHKRTIMVKPLSWQIYLNEIKKEVNE